MTSDATSVEPFPELQIELVFLIIEILLEIDPKRALDLVSLAKDIRPIAEKAIYRCLVLDQLRQARLLSETIKSGCRPESFYQDHVQALCIVSALQLQQLGPFFSACSKVQTLAIFDWIEVSDSETMTFDAALDALVSSGPRPSKLSCDIRWTLPSEGPSENHRFNLPLFHNVTHLELYDVFNNFRRVDGNHLHCLTNLAYLSLVMLDTTNFAILELLQKLSLADSILVCIIFAQFHFRESTVEPPTRQLSKDPRVVFALDGQRDETETESENILWRDLSDAEHFARQWGRNLNKGDKDMWEEAQSIVSIQRDLQRLL
ncbi:hypothetical protein C8J56DRAFT_143925 [Mycena floridula]|nr:hypothetical protein C8J56DRAFT_143925 [Mycena floridula]